MKPTTEVPTVTRVEVSPGTIQAFTDEHEFTGIAVELLIEAGS